MDDDLQARLDDYWSGRAPDYDAYQQRPERLERDRRAWRDAFSAVLPPPPAKILDVGTGSGYVAMLLADCGHDVTAIDHAPGMLELARQHAATRSSPPLIRFGDAMNPPGEPGSFDAITSRYLMWTLSDPAAALKAWRELLCPGGILAIVDATWFPEGFDEITPAFAEHYDENVQRRLPLAGSGSISDTADLVRGIGYADVTVTPLDAILELDLRYGVAPGHDARLQYLITGRRPS